MTMSLDTARAWVDIDLGALVANARTVAAACGARLLPMVKANGYGLGATAVARALEPLEPWGYGVATEAEGAALRAAGVARPILVATPLVPAAIDALLAAEEHLIVTYTGRSARTNEALPPATPVALLLEAVEGACAGADVHHHHALAPFGARAASAGMRSV